ncbi:MAG: SDR family oxidoreductase, partial [Phenylobacterium sp.]|nr:SDR family oxidoreductase [Phenylobacterium sp.]
GPAETARRVEAGGAKASRHQIDLADIGAVERWMRALADDGGYDVLFNNAGVVGGHPAFPDAPIEALRRVVDVNLTALIVTTQIGAQALRERGGGVIVNTVSTVALGKGFADALYASSKAGVMMFTRCCAGLKADWNVRVMGVLPGLTDTPILHKTGAGGQAAAWMAPILENNERCSPEDIAEAVIDLVRDDSLPGGDWVAVRRSGGRVERQWGHDEGG